METIDNTSNSLKKYPFSEAELLENIDEYNAHADEIAIVIESECVESSFIFRPDSTNEQIRTTTDLQENVQPETINKIENNNSSPSLINRFERGIKAFFK